MKISTGKVVDGRVVLDGDALPEGAVVVVLAAEENGITLNAEDEAALLEAIAEADRGELVDASEVLEQLP